MTPAPDQSMPRQPPARFEDANLAEAIEQGYSDMRLHHLAVERTRGHPFAQPLEAVHLRLHKAAPVVAAPLLQDAATQALACANGLVLVRRARTRLLPMSGVLARRDHRPRLPFGDGVQAASRVVGAIRADAVHALVASNLCQQLRQHRRIGASAMALLVTSMARISCICASMSQDLGHLANAGSPFSHCGRLKYVARLAGLLLNLLASKTADLRPKARILRVSPALEGRCASAVTRVGRTEGWRR